MPQHPDPDLSAADVVQEMIRESVEITASKPTPVKMEILGILDHLPDPDLKLREEVLAELSRHAVVTAQNHVQICLNTPVESNFHGGEAQQRVRRK